jgi:tetratricopeptide (TPR) repeat protein
LAELIPRRGTLGEEQLTNILYPILDGLRLVHEAGFIHRDIKPANIFVREDGSPVLLDFGSARQALGEANRTLTSLVSPGYAPFEQYHSHGEHQGPWTDIYALGATVYRAVVGVAPVDAVDRSEGLLRRGRDPLVSAVEAGAERYTARFLRSIDRALAFRDQDRPCDIDAWIAMLSGPEEVVDPFAIPVAESVPDEPSPFGIIEFPEEPSVVEAEVRSDRLGSAVAEASGPSEDAVASAKSHPDDAAPASDARAATAAPIESGKVPFIALLSSFIGDKGRRYYLDRFMKWSQSAKAPAFSWNPAGLFGPLWFLYRRMYLWGLLIHPLTAVVVAVMLLAAGSDLFFSGAGVPRPLAATLLVSVMLIPPAIYGNRVYFRYLQGRIEQAYQRFPMGRERRQWLAKSGGHSGLAAGLAAGLLVMLVLSALSDEIRRLARFAAPGPPSTTPAPRPRQPSTADQLNAARADIEALRLSTPAGNNAMEKIRAVLAADPGNEQALVLRALVVEKYQHLALAAAKKGERAKAARHLDRALKIAPDSKALLRHRQRLEKPKARDSQALVQQRQPVEKPKARD